ncbi:hypothetical protein V7S43_007061 [Phytophthora oleae]|uniref:Uncharacterized protein n=1 Tax=Phytophthora oleae TaxID=2107226 RepID=A0ABD3FR96_9STRA
MVEALTLYLHGETQEGTHSKHHESVMRLKGPREERFELAFAATKYATLRNIAERFAVEVFLWVVLMER